MDLTWPDAVAISAMALAFAWMMVELFKSK